MVTDAVEEEAGTCGICIDELASSSLVMDKDDEEDKCGSASSPVC